MIGPMAAPFILVTGFGAFETVLDNPSGSLAEALDGRPDVVGVCLPVTYGGVGPELDRVLAALPVPPVAILAMGVHRGAKFRLEAQAGADEPSLRPDTDDQPSPAGPRELLKSGVNLGACVQACEAQTKHPVCISQSAGGYVCDFVYGLVLKQAAELGIQALFLHVPPVDAVPLGGQEPVVNALVEELLAQAASSR